MDLVAGTNDEPWERERKLIQSLNCNQSPGLVLHKVGSIMLWLPAWAGGKLQVPKLQGPFSSVLRGRGLRSLWENLKLLNMLVTWNSVFPL